MTTEQISERVLDVLRAGFASWLTPDAEPDEREFATGLLATAEANHAQGTLPQFLDGMSELLLDE